MYKSERVAFDKVKKMTKIVSPKRDYVQTREQGNRGQVLYLAEKISLEESCEKISS
jgi:hypothetical protein